MDAAHYSATETLRDGRTFLIRAHQPEDREGILAAFGRASPWSMYLRFFAPKRVLSDRDAEYFLSVDFVDHIAILAVVEESGRPTVVGGASYDLIAPGTAEISFAIIDEYQGQGIGGALMRHLAKIGREAGLKEFVAEVLTENAPMLKVFKGSGLPMTSKAEGQEIHVTLRLV